MVLILIAIVLAFLFYLYKRNGSHFTKTHPLYKKEMNDINPVDSAQVETYKDDDHSDRQELKKRTIPRKTYLSGSLLGKYWGEITTVNGIQYEHELFYSFHIYEADVCLTLSATCACTSASKPECNGLHTEAEGGFANKTTAVFPREKLPGLLPIIVKKEGKEYAVNIHQPQLSAARSISRLHQTEGEEVFGTIEANITGFLLDFVVEEYLEPYPNNNYAPNNITVPDAVPPIRRERSYSNTSYRRSRRYSRSTSYTPKEGCISSVLGFMAIIVWGTFLIAILPQAAIVLPFIALPLLFRLLPPVIWKWGVIFVGAIICFSIFASIFNSGKYPRPIVRNKIALDTATRTLVNDSMITHHLQWKNYDDQYYQGSVTLRRSALRAAAQFKTSLQVHDNTIQSYDEMVYRLKEHDKNQLSGVYHLFDSIRTAQPLQSGKFAELIVSFVQQIPYAVILPKACDAALYSDQFIRHYLATPDAKCEGYQKFGINTPLEFMASLNGDCDTRTLLLYTMLSHYKYDVAILSSEYYNHSLIGINLPYNGTAFISGAKQYVLWETTAADIKPGAVPYQISNLNYWRISLKSE